VTVAVLPCLALPFKATRETGCDVSLLQHHPTTLPTSSSSLLLLTLAFKGIKALYQSSPSLHFQGFEVCQSYDMISTLLGSSNQQPAKWQNPIKFSTL
jgi:hypothetical protein